MRCPWTAGVVSVLLFPSVAFACGASAGGAAGVSSCSLEEHEEETRPKWRVGAMYAFTSTALRFDGDMRFDETRQAVFATLDYRATRSWTFEAGLGSTVGGRLEYMQSSYEFRPGLLASAGAAWRLLDADGARPFVVATGQLAFIATKTDPTSANGASVGYEALDLRMGASAGWPLWNTLTPYAGMRVFGGPVFWQYQGASVTGTDVHHFQVVGGALLRFLKRFDIFVEASPLGEQMLSLGAGCTL